MWVPDKQGRFGDVLLGFDTLPGYEKAGEKYHGATVGRVCGRISDASFPLNGKFYHLSSNDKYGNPVRNHLHGGFWGFHAKFGVLYYLKRRIRKKLFLFPIIRKMVKRDIQEI